MRSGLNLKDIAPWKRASAVEEFLSRRDGERCSETLQKVCNPEERSRQIEKAKGLSWLHPDYRADGESGVASASSGPVDGNRKRQSATKDIAAEPDGAGAGKRGRLSGVGRASCRSSSLAPDWSGNSSGGRPRRADPDAEESEEESVGHEDLK